MPRDNGRSIDNWSGNWIGRVNPAGKRKKDKDRDKGGRDANSTEQKST